MKTKNQRWEEENKKRWMFSAAVELGDREGFKTYALTPGDKNCFIHYHSEGHTPTEAVDRFIQYRQTGKR